MGRSSEEKERRGAGGRENGETAKVKGHLRGSVKPDTGEAF